MAKIITSDSVVFMDNTDNRKLDVYITSNLPTVQIKNSNTNPVTYTPNWASTPLVLKANAYLDSEDVTSKTTFVWYKKDVNGIETQISTTTNAQVIISNNADLDNNQLIVYICKAVYKASEVDNGIEDTEQITFSQVTTGLNGTSGTSAPAVQAQYSANGVNGWTTTLDATIHKYVRHSYDGGKTYTVAMKMVGEDGTSVVIKGTAYTSDTLISGQVVRLFSDSDKTISINTNGLSTGDSYLVSGYLCVYNKINDNFVCTGTIQGPQGVPGQNNYMYIRYSENSNGADMREMPTSSTIYIGVCISTSSKAPDTPNLYTWSKFVGDSAKSIILSGSSQIFKVTQGTSLKYEPSTILVSAQAINTTVAKWEYSANGGLVWVALDPSNLPGGIEFGSSQNTLMITGSELDSNTLVIRASNGEYKDVYTVYKVFDGINGSVGAKGEDAPIAFLTNENISIAANANGVINNTSTLRIVTGVAAYIGATKQIPTLGAIIDKPSDMNISIEDDATLQEKKLTISFNSNATLGSTNSNSGTITIPVTYPVVTNLKLSWSKINTGANGQKGDKGDQGIQGIQGPKGDQGVQGPPGANGKPSYFHIKYSANSNGNPMTETPSTYIGTYVDDQADDSDNYLKYTWSRFVGSQGAKGDQGIAGTNGADGKTSYLHIAYATSADGKSGFSVSDSANKTHIGQYTDYTEDDSADPTKYKWTLIKGDKGDQGVQGPKGNDGQQLYTWVKYADSPTSGMSNDPSGKTYIGLAYNKTTATESSTYSDYMWSLIKGETGAVGPKGSDGQQYYTWIKYADNASGANMSDSPTGKLYIGLAYNKTTSTESNTASDYTWALFKGDKGETGAIGAPGVDAVTFQVYSSNGYALSINTPTVTLQTFAYIGDVAITAGATYQWYVYNDSGWTAISGGTNAYLTIARENVAFSKSYMCKMTFNGVEYTSVATIDDKNDENKVFTTKPSNYAAGDLWVVGVDYAPAGVAVGTLLRAEHTNATYGDVDWVTATKYDKELNDLKDNIETYNQYFSFDSAEGLKISAKDNNGTPSQFSTSLTNERLSFNYGNEAIAYINGTKMNIKEAEIESPLTVTGKYSGSTMLQAPVINIGKFSIIVESNGSLSIVANT